MNSISIMFLTDILWSFTASLLYCQVPSAKMLPAQPSASCQAAWMPEYAREFSNYEETNNVQSKKFSWTLVKPNRSRACARLPSRKLPRACCQSPVAKCPCQVSEPSVPSLCQLHLNFPTNKMIVGDGHGFSEDKRWTFKRLWLWSNSTSLESASVESFPTDVLIQQISQLRCFSQHNFMKQILRNIQLWVSGRKKTMNSI